jgi:hypothetical protein
MRLPFFAEPSHCIGEHLGSNASSGVRLQRLWRSRAQ